VSNDTTERPPDVPSDEQLTMGIDPWERNWLKFSVALLAVFAALVTVAGFTAGFQLPGRESRVDPRTVMTEGPWAEPGVRELSDGRFEAYIIAQTWSFSPREIVLPVGAAVDIYVTSPDLQHGLKIIDTNVNVMVLPGQVSKLSFTFDEVGEFPYICHEYCGSGHAAMFGTVKVLSQADYEAQAAATDDTTDDTTDEAAEGDR
jgi:cytochrome c oxidase subunit II